MKNIYSLIALFIVISCSNPNAKVKQIDSQVVTLTSNLYGGTGGISVDKDGNIYSSDFGSFLGAIPNFTPANKVFKISPEGKITIYADSILGASGSVFDAEGNLYQSNIRGNYISKISPNGEVEIFTQDSIAAPVGVTFDLQNNLVVCNCGSGSLLKIDTSGNSQLFVKSELLKCPNGITLDEDGNLYVSNFNDGNVIKITPQGVPSIFVTLPGKNNGHINYLNGFLYVVARSAHQIYKVDLEGQSELYAGKGTRGRADGSRLEATFNYPNDLDFSPDGKYMYVNEEADTVSHPRILTPTSVRRISMDN